MGDPTIKSLNGAAGTVIKSGDQVVQDPASRRAKDTSSAKKTPAPAKDVVDKAPVTTAPVPPDFQARVAALESELAMYRNRDGELKSGRFEGMETRADAADEADRQAKVDQAKADREKGWLKKGLTDILMLFLRMFMPIISLISLVVRVVRIAYKALIKKEKIDWKREGMLFLADLAGAAPLIGVLGGPVGFLGGAAIGGVISAGIHGAVAVTDEDKHDFLGWEKDEPSGLRVGWEKAKGLASETYSAVTGKERPSETRQIEQSGIDTRPVKAGDIPVG